MTPTPIDPKNNKRMKVLVACEFSATVRNAFSKRGHDAWSCDLLPSLYPGKHITDDALKICKNEHWDLIIAHPPCTKLCVSGARWWKGQEDAQKEAIKFFMFFTTLECERVAIENPIGIMSTVYRKPDQIIQPWQFGHGEVKATCLWLYGLPKLVPTNIVDGREARIHKLPPTPDRWKLRSLTYQGIADAMADQWSTP